MGATLRALMSIKSFVSDLGHKRIMDIDTLPEDSFYSAFLALTDVATDEKRSESIDPTPVKVKLGKHFREFSGTQQQDAHEFFTDCINQLEGDLYPHLRVFRAAAVSKLVAKSLAGIQAEIQRRLKNNNKKKSANKGGKKGKKPRSRQIVDESDTEESTDTSSTTAPGSIGPVPGEDDDFWEIHAADGEMLDFETMYCPSKRNFGGVIETTVTCKACKNWSSNRECFRALSVQVFDRDTVISIIDSVKEAIGKDEAEGGDDKVARKLENDLEHVKPKGAVPSVSNLLELFFAPEVVEANCEKCPCKQAIISRKIVRPPRVLVIHLKRFGQNEYTGRWTKIMDEIELQPKLSIQPVAVSSVKEFQKPIPYDPQDFKQVEVNRKARLDAMALPKVEKAKAIPSGSASGAPFEPATKRRKVDAEIEPAAASSNAAFAVATSPTSPQADKENEKPLETATMSYMLDFATQEQEISQEVKFMEDAENEAFEPADGRSPPALNASEATRIDIIDDEYDIARALRESAAEQAKLKLAKEKTEAELDEEMQRALEASKKEQFTLNYDYADESQEIVTVHSSSSLQAKYAEEAELAHEKGSEKADFRDLPGNGSARTLALADVPTPPLSPSGTEEYEELISKVQPGHLRIFPEMGHPDPFLNDELVVSPSLKTERAAHSRNVSYNLLSIIHHIGSSPSHGHYVTDVYKADGHVWTHHDDSKVTTYREPTEQFLKSGQKRKTAYLLFYVNDAVHPVPDAAKRDAKGK